MGNMEHDYVLELKKRNPAWRLLAADNAPLVAGFLNSVFVDGNVRAISESDLIDRLEDMLCLVRETHGGEQYSRGAVSYLKDWADAEWLRRYYPPNAEEPQYDMTPAAEKAVSWIASLSESSFIGTESRLKTVFGLLRQIAEGSEGDPELRLAELKKRRAELDREIEAAERGEVAVLGPAALKDRFLQFASVARELLGDFRSVEQNFKRLDRDVRDKIFYWEEGRGALIEDVLNRRDAIDDSDQGRNFLAFMDFLLQNRHQREFEELLDKALKIPAIAELEQDRALRGVMYNWLEASGHVMRTISLLSAQLRVFLDNRVWLENRRITDIIKAIEASGRKLGGSFPPGAFMELDDIGVEVNLPMERPLFYPADKSSVLSDDVQAGEADWDAGDIFGVASVDRSILEGRISRMLQNSTHVSLSDILKKYPVELGLDELLAYVGIASEMENAVFDESKSEEVKWACGDELVRTARLDRIIFSR